MGVAFSRLPPLYRYKMTKDLKKYKLIAELRLLIDKYEDSAIWNSWFFIDKIRHILDKENIEE